MSKYNDTQINTLIESIVNLKQDEVIKIPYYEDSANLRCEPFKTLFPKDHVRIRLCSEEEGLFVYEGIPAHDLIYNSDEGTLLDELGCYTEFMLKTVKDVKFQDKYVTLEELSKHVDRLLWNSSCYSEYVEFDNIKAVATFIKELERYHVNIANFKVVKKDCFFQ